MQIGRQATYHLLHADGDRHGQRDDRNRHLLGIRVGTLAEARAPALALRHLTPIVRALAQETGGTSPHASGCGRARS